VMTIEESEKLYKNDPAFHAIVDMMTHAATTHGYTPAELRGAAALAACMVELRFKTHPVVHCEIATFSFADALTRVMLDGRICAVPSSKDTAERPGLAATGYGMARGCHPTMAHRMIVVNVKTGAPFIPDEIDLRMRWVINPRPADSPVRER
jgi:hypothetical protein